MFNKFVRTHKRRVRKILNIDYLIAKKWSGQNRTSQTGSTAPVTGCILCVEYCMQASILEAGQT